MRNATIAVAGLFASLATFHASTAHADPTFGEAWGNPSGPAPGTTEVRVDRPLDAPRVTETPLARRTQIGLRLGYARATAGTTTRGAISEGVPATLPITLDFGRFVGDHVYLGGALGFMGTFRDCSVCKGRGVSLAFVGRYHFARSASLDPWLSVSTGFDALHLSRGSSSSEEIRLGWSSALAAGLDMRAASWLLVGPYASLGPTFQLATMGRSSRPTVPIGQATIGFRGAFEVL